MAKSIEMDMSANPSEFVEAVTEFAARRVVTREEADALSAYARKRAWWITGVAQMDVANDAHQSILDSLKNGTSFEDWKKTAGSKIEAEWGRKDSTRLQLIYRNATTSALNAGRLEQMEEPHIVAVRPYKMLDVVADSRTSKICSKFIEPPVVLPWNDPWWLTHSPPLHHGCRSGIRSLRKSVAERKGILETAPADPIGEGWGLDPRIAEPPHPSERNNPPDPDIQLESAVKGGKYLRETKPVEIPKKLIDKNIVFDPDVHARNFKRTVGESSAAEVMAALNNDELNALAAKPPDITVSRGLTRGKYLGIYSPSNNALGITAKLDKRFYGQTFKHGVTHSLGLTKKTELEAVQTNLRHEFGHFLVANTAGAIPAISQRWMRGNKAPITRYARTNKDEYFAESYAAYRNDPEELRSLDPNGYEMVLEVLTLAGMKHD